MTGTGLSIPWTGATSGRRGGPLTPTDNDQDGCQDSSEDDDDDWDGIPDSLDACPRGDVGWTPNSTTDFDSDGCQDSGEDADDDNDGVSDTLDLCPYRRPRLGL